MSRQLPADTLPPTARAIALLLASTPSVHDAQPGVLHQLLEFFHRYATQVLQDAQVYADHAGRQGKIEMEDVVLAVQARVGWEFGGRVPKEVRPLVDVWLAALDTVPVTAYALVSDANELDAASACPRSVWCSITALWGNPGIRRF